MNGLYVQLIVKQKPEVMLTLLPALLQVCNILSDTFPFFKETISLVGCAAKKGA